MIDAGGVVVRYAAHTALDRVDFTARTGRVTGIVGPNGSGKSTLLRALLRTVPLAAGSVRIDGDDQRHRSRRWIARRVAFVSQHAAPDPALLVVDEVALGGLARRGVRVTAGASFDADVARALDLVGLSGLAGRRLGTLSGGELQRVALARALAHDAPHVLLDEPTNHLDLHHQLELITLLRSLEATVIVVMHDLNMVARCCDDVMALDAGRVVASGTTEQVLVPEVLDRIYRVRSSRLKNDRGGTTLDFALSEPAPVERISA
ncbi:MAG: ABC transporter ATP-binding protein [Beutenbergiaceae bacterium]